MSDQSSDATPQEGSDATPDAQASEPQAGTSTTSSNEAAGQESADARIARLEAELAQTRKEAAARRVEAKNATARATELEQAQMSEAEKAQKRAEDAEARAAAAEARLAEQTTRSAVYAEAERLKAVAPSDVYAIVRDTISEAGDDADIASIVKDALEARPHLVRSAQSGAPANGARDTTTDGQRTDDQLREMVYGRRSAGMFDAAEAARRGGGVQIPGGANQVERR